MGYATGYAKGLDAGRKETGIKVYKDGNQWCALVGETLGEDIAGFGLTPAAALMNLMVENVDTLNGALGGENVEVPDEPVDENADD
jgi:hypothetical protein